MTRQYYYMLQHQLYKESKPSEERLFRWAYLSVFLLLVGGIAYLCIR